MLGAVLGLLGAPVAWAQPAPETPEQPADPPPEDAKKAEATVLFLEGNTRLLLADYEGALARYQAAYEIYPSAQILLNIGTAHVELKRTVEAIETYEKYVIDEQSDPQRVAEVKEVLIELYAKTARIEVVVEAAGAEVSIDGKVLGTSPIKQTFRVELGEHTVAAEGTDFPRVEKKITVKSSETETVTLEKKVEAPPIKIKPQPPVPIIDLEKPPIVVAEPSTPKWAPWVAVGVAAGAFGTGAVLGARTLDSTMTIAAAENSARGANVSYAIAGTATASAVILWWLSRD